jgi:hypothetical protein
LPPPPAHPASPGDISPALIFFSGQLFFIYLFVHFVYSLPTLTSSFLPVKHIARQMQQLELKLEMEARTRPGSALTRLGCVRGAAGYAASVAFMAYAQSVPLGVYAFPSVGARAHAKPYPNVGSLPGLCATRGIKL